MLVKTTPSSPTFVKSAWFALLTALFLSNPSLAETATATANSNHANQATATATATNNANILQSHSVADMVALGQVAKQNEAVNDAVFGNEAIQETLNHDALPLPTGTQNQVSNQSSSQTSANQTTQIMPRQSTEKGVDSKDLALQSAVIDQARVLTASEKSALEHKIRQIYQRGLAQPAIVIVPTTSGTDIFSYAMQVAERWQLGGKDSDNGLLIVVAVNDRDLQILTGYGLEGVVPDAIAKRIIREDITPYFKQGDYAGGLNTGLNRIEERLTTDPQILAQADAEQAKQQQVSEASPIPFAIMALFVGFVLTGIFGRFLGASVTAGSVIIGGTLFGFGFFTSLIIGILLFVFLLIRNTGGGRGGGVVIVPTGGFGGGGFGGGFGGGGYGGGGGGFGGGGAGGSW